MRLITLGRCVFAGIVSGAVLCAEVPSMPMPIEEKDTTNYRWLQKPVLASRLLDDAEQTNRWSHHGHGQMLFTSERARAGRQSVRLTSPTKTDAPNKVTGRPFGEAVARLNIPGDDWTAENRLSFWVYPHLPGFKVISMLVKLRNDGAIKVPDSYGREGLNFFLLRPDEWNQVVWEIPHLSRDKVTGVEFIYRLQGHEPGATNVVCFDIDQVELQRVEPDHFEGWQVAPGRIAFSHSGYLPRGSKSALTTGMPATEFRVVAQSGTNTVLLKPVRILETPEGEVQVLDFSEIEMPGRYRLEIGRAQTPWFRIGDDLWRESIWKTVNLFFCERCGFAVPDIHDVCHEDWQAKHGTNAITINGGWHDAGDLSQGLINTSEAVYAMFDLAERLIAGPGGLSVASNSHTILAARLIQEARWGLDWVLKTRFGDGARVTWATMDYWTDGVLGTVDDTLGDVRNTPFDNFMGAAAEAKAAQVFEQLSQALTQVGRKDPLANSTFPWAAGSTQADARKALQAAREDWRFAIDRATSPNLEVASAGAIASLELFQATGEQVFADKAVELADIILRSQQREIPGWDVPLTGFFYTGPDKKRILHYAHRGHEQAPIVALAQLCHLLPGHANWMKWYSAVVLHSEYLKRIAQFTEPWSMLPASVYFLSESKDPRFQEQVRQGIRLAEGVYLRRFPVWFDFRGNSGTTLTQAKALSAASRLRGDEGSADLARLQLEWTVGRNPFCQSLMFGEGHDYAPQYTAMSGDMVGSLPVGVQTRENLDLPYWPAANCYNYKEVWVHPSSRWLAIMADLDPAARAKDKPDSTTIELTQTDWALENGGITIRALARGQGRHKVTLRATNLEVEAPEQTVEFSSPAPRTLTWKARRLSPKEPWVAVVVPEHSPTGRRDLFGQ